MNILPIRIIIYGICYFFPINFSHMYLNLQSSDVKLFPSNITKSLLKNHSHCNVSAVCTVASQWDGEAMGWRPMKNAGFSGIRWRLRPTLSGSREAVCSAATRWPADRNTPPPKWWSWTKEGNINIFAPIRIGPGWEKIPIRDEHPRLFFR